MIFVYSSRKREQDLPVCISRQIGENGKVYDPIFYSIKTRSHGDQNFIASLYVFKKGISHES